MKKLSLILCFTICFVCNATKEIGNPPGKKAVVVVRNNEQDSRMIKRKRQRQLIVLCGCGTVCMVALFIAGNIYNIWKSD